MKILFAIVWIIFLVEKIEAAPACDRKTSPWLNGTCEEPSITNPDDACRRVAKMKNEGLTYESVIERAKKYDANADKLRNAREILIAPKSWEICSAVMETKCLQKAVAASNSYRSIIKKYAVDREEDLPAFVNYDLYARDYDRNLQRNYKVIADENLRIMRSLKTLSNQSNSSRLNIVSLKNLEDANKGLFEAAQDLVSAARVLSEKESSFNHLLQISINELEYESRVNGAFTKGIDCEYLFDKMKVYTLDLAEHRKMVVDYRVSMENMRRGRNHAIAYAYNGLRFKNVQEYALKINKKVDDLENELGKSMVLDRFLWSFQEFWSENSAGGLAQNLHTRFYFYSEPLRNLEILREKLNLIKKSVNDLPVGEKEKLETENVISSKIDLVDKDIDFIKSKGWKGFLTLQKASAEKRMQLLPDNKACQEDSKIFLDEVERIDSLDSFDQASELYKDSVTSCSRAAK